MSQLETFIREHRNELDVFTPSEGIWSGIEAGIKNPTFIESSISWLKYAGFSASAIAVLVYLALPSSEKTTIPAKEIKPVLSPTVATTEPTPVSAELKVRPEIKPQVQANRSVPVPLEKKLEEKAEVLVPVMESDVAPLPDVPFVERREQAFMLVGDSMNADTLFSGIRSLEIVCSSMDINISSVPGDEILFSATKNKNEEKEEKRKSQHLMAKIKIERIDSVLKITEEKNLKGTNSSCNKNGCMMLNFRVPASTALTVRNAYGDVRASGLQGKQCDIDVRSGDVKLDNLNTDLKLNMGYGDLSVSTITGNISAQVSSGDVSITGQTGNSNIRTSYGDQKYTDINGIIHAECSSGDVRINNMNGNTGIRSSYGDIVLENYKGSPSLRTNSGDIRGRNVELTGNMEANTSYGDIKFDLANDLNALSFELNTQHGDITIEKEGKTYENVKQLEIKKGSILIKAHTNSGDQSYK